MLAQELQWATSSRRGIMEQKLDGEQARENLKNIEETAGKIKALAVSLAAG
jgi:hypothetical protein